MSTSGPTHAPAVHVKAQIEYLIDVREIAEQLSHMSDDEQAVFFNAFAEQLAKNCETPLLAETQCYWIGEKLSAPAARVFKEMLEGAAEAASARLAEVAPRASSPDAITAACSGFGHARRPRARR